MENNLRGIFPILTTVFGDDGEFDERGQRRVVDFLLQARVDGLVTLANASEGYALSDSERERAVAVVMDHVAGRIPVIVGVSHPSARVAVERCRAAERAGAAGVLSLPPFYGGWTSDAAGVYRYFAELDGAAGLAVIVQDHPLSGIPLPPPLLARMANELDRARYFKIEVPRSPTKMAELLQLANGRVTGIFGGMGGITFIEELERGACGTMPSSAFPDVFAAIWRAHTGGDSAQAREIFERYLPLIRFELHLGGKDFQKELLKLGGVIQSAFTRTPVPPSWDETTRLQMLDLVKRYDLLALRFPLPPFEKN